MGEETAKRRAFQKSASYFFYRIERFFRGLRSKKQESVAEVIPGPDHIPEWSPDEILEMDSQSLAISGLARFLSLIDQPAEEVELGHPGQVHWVVPDFSPGAGGHMTAFRMVQNWEQTGGEAVIWVGEPSRWESEPAAQDAISQHFLPLRAEVRFLPRDFRPVFFGQALVATDRWTAYQVAAAGGPARKFYFIQDWEPSFYPVGTEYYLALQSYFLGLEPITAGEWLAGVLRKEVYGGATRPICSVPLAVNGKEYFPSHSHSGLVKVRKRFRIAFYARIRTPRRCVELGLLALELLERRGVDFEVIFFGEENINGWDVTFPFENAGVIPLERLRELYQNSDLGLCLSGTNYSLVPLEMMACGLPVLDLDLPSVRAAFSEDEILLAKPTPASIADTLEDAMGSPAKLAACRERALAKVKQLSWEESASVFNRAIS